MTRLVNPNPAGSFVDPHPALKGFSERDWQIIKDEAVIVLAQTDQEIKAQ